MESATGEPCRVNGDGRPLLYVTYDGDCEMAAFADVTHKQSLMAAIALAVNVSAPHANDSHPTSQVSQVYILTRTAPLLPTMTSMFLQLGGPSPTHCSHPRRRYYLYSAVSFHHASEALRHGCLGAIPVPSPEASS